MSNSEDHILVIGHRNPDTDASVSAHTYASFLNMVGRYKHLVVPGVLGQLGPQARYVFERAGCEPPALVNDVRPQVQHVLKTNIQSLGVNDRLHEATAKLIRTGFGMLPVLNQDGHIQSVFSNRSDASRFLMGFDAVPVLGSLLDWNDLLDLPGSTQIGQTPADFTIHGTLVIPMDGHCDDISGDDIVLCRDLQTVLQIPLERRPRWVVLVNENVSAKELAELNDRGTYVLQYHNAVSDFLYSLTGQIRLGSLQLSTGACLGELDYLHDVQDVIRAARHALPVVSADGVFVGLVSESDLISAPRRQVILTDHFESSQSATGIESAEILEIVDHHHIGDIVTNTPLRVDCRPVGSSSTIVALNCQESNIVPTQQMATLMLGGIISDTLGLTGPTTTPTDKVIAAQLAAIANVDLQTFGLDVLKAGDDLQTSDPADIWSRDQKVFSIRNQKFAVAQLETVSLASLTPDRLEAFRTELVRDFHQQGYLLSLLLITDVLTGDSWVTAAESTNAQGVLESSFGSTEATPDWTIAKGVVSRKKQVIPRVMQALAQCG